MSSRGERAADEGRTFSVALAGGTRPRLYQFLASEAYRSRVDWSKVEVFFGDEPHRPPDHKDSNYRMAHEARLSKVPIPGDTFTAWRATSTPTRRRRSTALMLKEKFGDGARHGPARHGRRRAHRVPLPRHRRPWTSGKHRAWLTSSRTPTPPELADHDDRAVHQPVARGACPSSQAPKAARLQEVLEGADPRRLPDAAHRPSRGNVTWLLDAAAGMGEGNRTTD